MFIHKPVMPDVALKYLAMSSDKILVDTTCGEGGHSEFFFNNSDNIKKLVCIEQDKDILKIAKKRLKKHENVLFVNDNFTNLKNILKQL